MFYKKCQQWADWLSTPAVQTRLAGLSLPSFSVPDAPSYLCSYLSSPSRVLRGIKGLDQADGQSLGSIGGINTSRLAEAISADGHVTALIRSSLG